MLVIVLEAAWLPLMRSGMQCVQVVTRCLNSKKMQARVYKEVVGAPGPRPVNKNPPHLSPSRLTKNPNLLAVPALFSQPSFRKVEVQAVGSGTTRAMSLVGGVQLGPPLALLELHLSASNTHLTTLVVSSRLVPLHMQRRNSLNAFTGRPSPSNLKRT